MVLQNKLYSECCCHPGTSGSSRAGELNGLCVAMSSHALYPYVCCVLPEQSDVRAPKSTRHVQAISWSKVKAQDEVKAVQLMIQTSLPNSEGHSRSRSDSSKSLRVNYLPLLLVWAKCLCGEQQKDNAIILVRQQSTILQLQLALWSL